MVVMSFEVTFSNWTATKIVFSCVVASHIGEDGFGVKVKNSFLAETPVTSSAPE